MKLLRRQHGQALMLLLLILVLGASWFMVRRLDAVTGNFTAVNREHNALILNRAKQALIGYVAAQAAKSFEDNPGALPCPEHAWYIDLTDKEGGAGPSIGVSNPGYGTANCSSIGRYPWRTIGTEKFIDASGQPLWMVVGPTWRKTSTTTKTVINSNATGDLTVDGQNVVALIVAPGAAMITQAGTTPAGTACTARTQARSAAAGTMDPLDYLECYDASTLQFSTTGPGASFNDQVATITVADLMPGIEAAIADRMAREIAPVLKAVYAAPNWGLTGSNILYPYAAPFADPSTSSMQGTAGTVAGLLPLSTSETSPGSGAACTAGASAPRCAPSFVAWTSASLSGASIYSPSCTYTATQVDCTFYYRCLLFGCSATTVAFTLNADASNVGMALRQLNTSAAMTNISSPTASGAMNSSGAATITLNGQAAVSGSGSFLLDALCGLVWPLNLLLGCKDSTISVPIYLLADHPILDSTNGTYGWYLRNKWHELSYYAVAANLTPGVMPAQPSCTAGVDCLNVSNVTPASGQRAILVLAGRSINNTARPSSTLANYVEFGNAAGTYERQAVSTANDATLKKPFNDRLVIVDCSNPNASYPYPCDNR